MVEDDRLPTVPDADLIFLLFRARQSIYRTNEKDAARYGVTLEQATVMRLIESKSDISLDDICRIMIREHHTISSLIRRMVTRGLVQVTKGSKGKISLSLSKKGDEALKRMSATDNRGKLVSILSDLEKRRLAYYLVKMTKNALKEAGKLEEYHIPGGFGGNIPED